MLNTTLIGESLSLIIPKDGDYKVTRQILKLYDNFNKEHFDNVLNINSSWRYLVNTVYDIFCQHVEIRPYDDIECFNAKKPSKGGILLGFSGGLDSAYHALSLKEQGWDVYLVHFANLNSYENNNALKSSIEFAKLHCFDLTIVQVKKNNKNKLYWVENPIKNQLIQAFLVDFGVNNGIYDIALGDDYSMSFERGDFILGTNTTDCREVQNAFEDGIGMIYPRIQFHMIDRPIGSTSENKFDRLKKLIDYKSIDTYYSCVGAGRFNKYNHDRENAKYGIELPKYNCGSYCTKCSLHNLLMCYSGITEYPKEFISKCWERLWRTEHGSIKALFGKDIPIETRIKNLYIY